MNKTIAFERIYKEKEEKEIKELLNNAISRYKNIGNKDLENYKKSLEFILYKKFTGIEDILLIGKAMALLAELNYKHYSVEVANDLIHKAFAIALEHQYNLDIVKLIFEIYGEIKKDYVDINELNILLNECI